MSENKDTKEEYPSFGGSGSGQCVAYSVEGRYNNRYPTEVLGQLFDNRWQQIQFKKAPVGVPVAHPLHPFASELRLFNWEAAQALRWWAHAALEVDPFGGLCFETRIVEHRVSYSYSSEAVTHHEHIGGDEGEWSSRGPRKRVASPAAEVTAAKDI